MGATSKSLKQRGFFNWEDLGLNCFLFGKKNQPNQTQQTNLLTLKTCGWDNVIHTGTEWSLDTF